MSDHYCPVCKRQFGDLNAAYQHTRNKHGRRAAIPLRAIVRQEREERAEPSIGDIVAEAQANRRMGILNAPWVEEMFGDYL